LIVYRSAVDVVDVVLVVLIVAAALHGLRLGALTQVLTYVGFWLGLVLGALLTVVLVGSLPPGALRGWVALVLIIGLAVAFGSGGRVLGGWSNAALRRHHLGGLDQALGVAVAMVAVLLSAWLVATVLAQTRYTWLDAALQRSAVLRTVDSVMPPAPTFVARVQSFLNDGGFTTVFVSLAPPDEGSVAVPSTAQASALAATAAFSTVKIEGQACGFIQQGSGFVVGPGLVVTNAHVVAGESATSVLIGTTPYPATTVSFDPEFDLAVLRTAAPLGHPLALDPTDATRGTQAAVLGYPENGPLTVSPAGVVADLSAQGRDIYNSSLVDRDVYEVDADIRPGNSGGPLVDAAGQVIGVVFSRSTVAADVGYALTSPGVLSRVQQAEGRHVAVSTGQCVSG
jgi:S1-C subfamily serine protease